MSGRGSMKMPTTIKASILLHHAMRKGGGYTAASSASKDQGIGGLSWLSPYMDFSADPLNGEFRALCDSVFDIFPDPHFREVNLSDCNYIVKRKAIAKSTGAIMFPEHEKDILNSKSEYKSDFFVIHLRIKYLTNLEHLILHC